MKNPVQYSSINGWDRFALATTDGKLIPVLHLAPKNKSLGYTIVCNPKGKAAVSKNIINELKKKGAGIVIADLSGTGEISSPKADTLDGAAAFHTLARSELWLGKTILGEWVRDLNLITGFLKQKYQAQKVSIDGSREAGLAALFLGVLEGNIDNITLREAPISYIFDNRDSLSFFTMAIHIPGFLNWGDVSLAAALGGEDIRFINPVTMSGERLSEDKLKQFRAEFDKLRRVCKRPGQTFFDN